jgi:hypothetical protein
MSKPIRILITVTEDGKSVAYEKWMSEEKLKKLLDNNFATDCSYTAIIKPIFPNSTCNVTG